MVNTPSAASKSSKRPGEAKKKIVGATPVNIAPAPGSSSSNGGDPKVKTATRSKSGCMTCRIRRKKCDLERIGDSCQTCVRLRIECLGWGSKRPEALRDANIVKQLQNMIKIFLASNNMIKGSARSSAQFINQGPPLPPAQTQNASILQTTYSSGSEFNAQGNNPYSPSNGTNGPSCGPFLLPSTGTTLVSPAGADRSTGPHQTPSYVGANFLRFDFLRQHDIQGAMSHSLNDDPSTSQNGSVPTHLQLNGHPSSIRPGSKAGNKGKSRQAAVRRVKKGLDDDDDDDMDEEGDELEHEEEEDMKPNPRGMPPPNYPTYDDRYPPHIPYPQPHPYAGLNPYNPPPPHHYSTDPYNQSDLRTSSLDRGALHQQVSDLERERRKKMDELNRKGIPSYGRDPHGGQPYAMAPTYDPHQFVWGAGVGAAGPGRNYMTHHMPNGPYPPPPLQTGYPPHVGYSNPGHLSQYTSSYARGDPTYNGPPRLGGRSLLNPPLSTARTSAQISPIAHPRVANGTSSDYMTSSENTSPTTPLSASTAFRSHRPSIDVNGNAYPIIGGEGDADMEADVDGEPMTTTQLMHEISLKTADGPVPIQSAQQRPLSLHSSFGETYFFDKHCQDADINLPNTTSLIIPNSASLPDAFAAETSLAQAMVDPAFYATFLSNGGTLQSIGLGSISETELVANPTASLLANVDNIDFTLFQPFQRAIFAPAPQPSPPPAVSDFTQGQLVLLDQYRRHISKLQYIIAHNFDPTLSDELYDLAISNKSARIGTLTLTALFKTRMRGLQVHDGSIDSGVGDVLMLKHQMAESIAKKLEASPNATGSAVDEGDAMGSLHMLSAVLFEGGTDAQWDAYLDIAKAWVANQPIVKTGRWIAAGDASSGDATVSAGLGQTTSDGVMRAVVQAGENVYHLDKKRAFIIKASFWFDILGAVTMRRAPHFLAAYKELFGKQGGSAMEKIMGCDEKVLLAIAETAALAKWRWDMEHEDCLSYMELVSRASEIEKRLSFIGPVYYGGTFVNNSATINKASEAAFSSEMDPSARWFEELFGPDIGKSITNNGGGLTESSSSNGNTQNPGDSEEAHTTRLISNVFRATAKLYLHTVVSGCNPDVKEIKLAVEETVKAFDNLPASTLDRSLVFPIALAGCMTDDPQYRERLAGRLKRLGREGEAVGNSKSCLQLMEKVWEKRDAPGGSRKVDWIDTMREMGWSLLLV